MLPIVLCTTCKDICCTQRELGMLPRKFRHVSFMRRLVFNPRLGCKVPLSFHKKNSGVNDEDDRSRPA